MNFYNPYTSIPGVAAQAATRGGGFLSSLFRNGINWGTLLNNTHRTLGLINQAIPVIKQVSPVVKNAKTMFRVFNEFRKGNLTEESFTQATTKEEPKPQNTQNNQTSAAKSTRNLGPTFFV